MWVLAPSSAHILFFRLIFLLSFGTEIFTSATQSKSLYYKLHNPGLLGSHFGYVDIPASFDYVVVGGGTAGLTIAKRLAQKYTVAIIEAGSSYELDNGNHTDVPADASYYLGKDPLWKNPLIDWLQITTPQPGLENKPVLFPQGRTLGGGSARNFMWYQRGSTTAYQKWADEVDDQSYSFSNFLKYFKMSARFTPIVAGRAENSTPRYSTDDFSPFGGPLQVSYPKFASPAASWLARGMEAIGLNEIDGMQDGNLLGWTWIAQTIDPVMQTRSTSQSSFLGAAIRAKDNLVVYDSTLAKKIVFDANKKATGIVVETGALGSGSVTYTINATKEIIVSSGAFRSPQLLMVSGIGPAPVLQSKGIDVVADRPGVGENLWDHLWFGPSYAVKTLTHSWLGNSAFARVAADEYNAHRTGILTNVGGDLLAFEKLPPGTISNSTRADLDSTFGGNWPDIELFSLDAYTGTLNDYLLGGPKLDNFTAVSVALVSPFSRGNVTISSNDTKIHPLVNPNWLTDARDQEVAIAGFKRARAIFESDAVKPILKGEEAWPGKNVMSDEDILASIRKGADTIHHPVGTCKMGKPNDSMAVVNTQAFVYGVMGLRVVDASVFPMLPPGHPQATVYALAEKIADIILNAA